MLFVNGPPSTWQSAPDLETIALTQPCTNSKTLVALDGALAGINGILGIVYLTMDEHDYPDAKGTAAFSLIWAGVQTAGAVIGNGKVNQCRAFQARLLESRGGDAFGQATYNWLDEFSPAPDFGADPPDLPVAIPSLRWFDQLFPAPDFGVNAFDPVFGGSISNTPKH